MKAIKYLTLSIISIIAIGIVLSGLDTNIAPNEPKDKIFVDQQHFNKTIKVGSTYSAVTDYLEERDVDYLPPREGNEEFYQYIEIPGPTNELHFTSKVESHQGSWLPESLTLHMVTVSFDDNLHVSSIEHNKVLSGYP